MTFVLRLSQPASCLTTQVELAVNGGSAPGGMFEIANGDGDGCDRVQAHDS